MQEETQDIRTAVPWGLDVWGNFWFPGVTRCAIGVG